MSDTAWRHEISEMQSRCRLYHRHHSGPYLMLLHSLHASSVALRHFATEYRDIPVCLHASIRSLDPDFKFLGEAFDTIKNNLRCCSVGSIWSSNAIASIKTVQSNCHLVWKQLMAISQQYKSLHLLVPDHVFRQIWILRSQLQAQAVVAGLFVAMIHFTKPGGWHDGHCYHGLIPDICRVQLQSRDACEHEDHHASRSLTLDLIEAWKMVQQSTIHFEEMANKGSAELGQITKGEKTQLRDDSSDAIYTADIMTPMEEWSDVGSVVTKIDPGTGEAITRHSLQVCANTTTRFLDLVRNLQESFGTAPGEARLGSEDVNRLHNAYNDLVVKLMHGLGAPMLFQKDDDSSAQAATSRSPAATHNHSRDRKNQNPKIGTVERDTTLEMILNGMDPEPNEKDMMKLVFHWTIFTEFEGFKREEVMAA